MGVLHAAQRDDITGIHVRITLSAPSMTQRFTVVEVELLFRWGFHNGHYYSLIGMADPPHDSGRSSILVPQFGHFHTLQSEYRCNTSTFAESWIW